MIMFSCFYLFSQNSRLDSKHRKNINRTYFWSLGKMSEKPDGSFSRDIL